MGEDTRGVLSEDACAAEWTSLVQAAKDLDLKRKTECGGKKGKPTQELIDAAQSLAARRKQLENSLSQTDATKLRDEMKGKQPKHSNAKPKQSKRSTQETTEEIQARTAAKKLRVASHFLTLDSWTGKLTLSGAPNFNKLSGFVETGVTHVITLQKVTEPAFKSVTAAVEAHQLEWTHISLSGGRVDGEGDVEGLRNGIPQIIKLLKRGRGVLVHCAAGLHRTGVVAYLIVRLSGRSVEQSLADVHTMRQVTHEELTKERRGNVERGIDWAGLNNLHARAEFLFQQLFVTTPPS